MTARVSMAARSNSQLAQGEVNKILIRTFGLRAGDLTIDESCTVRASVSELTLLRTGSTGGERVDDDMPAAPLYAYTSSSCCGRDLILRYHGIMIIATRPMREVSISLIGCTCDS